MTALDILSSEETRKEVQLLIDKYKRLVDSGQVNEYNEANTNKDFILPLFHALGWDIENTIEDEVTAEKPVSKGRVDYAFRISGIPKFFLETKAFHVNIDDRKWIDQAINYSYLKGVTWAVLTNFKKIKVFNTEIKASNIHTMLFFELEVADFISKFEKLLLLSRESFKTKQIDSVAEEWGKKLPKKPIDERLFSDLANAREILSQNIIKNDKKKILTAEDVEESVQKIISRLIFIRTLEDKEFEEPILNPLAREEQGKPIISRLNSQYRKLDETYDSKIFEKHLCEDLEIDNYPLRTVIEGLYRSEEQLQNYNFDDIDADILGGIYEEYLSFILKKIKGGFKLNGDSVHKKLKGIYYTPKYIVDYILRTIFEQLKNEKVDFKNIRLIDPACGSGSFLIKAYDYFQRQFEYPSAEGLPIINYEDKVRILQNNIYGIDLDPSAVEIAQLNLFLKSVEKKKHLPLLKDKIKCGNSLIEDKKVDYKRGMTWENEFPDVFKNGKKFDIVIGNPPYVRNTSLPTTEKDYYSKFESAHKQYDLYILFVEEGIKKLRDGGYLGFIIPNKLLSADYAEKIREIILRDCDIIKIVDVSDLEVFKSADTYPIILILRKGHLTKSNSVQIIKCSKEEDLNKEADYEIQQTEFSKNSGFVFSIHANKQGDTIIKKIDDRSVCLETLYEVRKGIETGDDKNRTFIFEGKPDRPKAKAVLGANTIGRYYINWNNRYVIYDENILNGPRKPEYFEREKIVTGRTVKRLSFALDTQNYYALDTTQIMYPKQEMNQFVILGLINSKLINFYYSTKFQDSHMKGGYFRCYTNYLEKIPINKEMIDNLQKDHKIKQELIELTTKMYTLTKEIQQMGDKKTNERERIEIELKETDEKIDNLVYSLYDITSEEKQIIENSIK